MLPVHRAVNQPTPSAIKWTGTMMHCCFERSTVAQKHLLQLRLTLNPCLLLKPWILLQEALPQLWQLHGACTCLGTLYWCWSKPPRTLDVSAHPVAILTKHGWGAPLEWPSKTPVPVVFHTWLIREAVCQHATSPSLWFRYPVSRDFDNSTMGISVQISGFVLFGARLSHGSQQ